MSKHAEYETMIRKIKEAALPEIDVTGQVMSRIRTLNERKIHQPARRRAFKRPWVWVTAAALCFIAAVPLSAAILPAKWNGIDISITNDHGKNARIDAFKELLFGPIPTSKKEIEDTLTNHKNMKKTLTLEETKTEFPFRVLRPEHGDLTPSKSIGALMNITEQTDGSPSKIIGYRAFFYDFYEQGKQWMIVTQSLDEEATKFLNGTINSMSSTYAGDWEAIGSSDRLTAMFVRGSKENRLIVQYKTDDKQVIELKVNGNASKDKLVELAEAYVGKGEMNRE